MEDIFNSVVNFNYYKLIKFYKSNNLNKYHKIVLEYGIEEIRNKIIEESIETVHDLETVNEILKNISELCIT